MQSQSTRPKSLSGPEISIVVVGPFKRRHGYGLQYKSQVVVYHPFLRFYLAIKFAAKQLLQLSSN